MTNEGARKKLAHSELSSTTRILTASVVCKRVFTSSFPDFAGENTRHFEKLYTLVDNEGTLLIPKYAEIELTFRLPIEMLLAPCRYVQPPCPRIRVQNERTTGKDPGMDKHAQKPVRSSLSGS